jgi:hypothetical protein
MDEKRTARIRALYEQVAKTFQQIENEHGAALEDVGEIGFADGFAGGFAAGQAYAQAPKEADAATFLRGWFAGARFERSHPNTRDIDEATTDALIQQIIEDPGETTNTPAGDTEQPARTLPEAMTQDTAQPSVTAQDLNEELYRLAAKALPEGTDHGTIVLFAHAWEALPDSPAH